MSGEIQRFVVEIQPTAAITDETITIMSVPKGAKVLWVYAKALVKGAPAFADGTMTFTIGDAGDADGFVTVFDSALLTVDKPVGAQGAYQARAGGKTYTAATNMTATYDYTAGSTGAQTVVNPKLRLIIAIAQG